MSRAAGRRAIAVAAGRRAIAVAAGRVGKGRRRRKEGSVCGKGLGTV